MARAGLGLVLHQAFGYMSVSLAAGVKIATGHWTIFCAFPQNGHLLLHCLGSVWEVDSVRLILHMYIVKFPLTCVVLPWIQSLAIRVQEAAWMARRYFVWQHWAGARNLMLTSCGVLRLGWNRTKGPCKKPLGSKLAVFFPLGWFS